MFDKDKDYVVVDGRRLLRVSGGDGTPEDQQKPLLELLNEQRDKALAELEAHIDARQAERDEFEARESVPDEERSAFDEAETAYETEFSRREAEVTRLDQRIAEQELKERRREAAAEAARGRVEVRSEPLTYSEHNAHEVSYFRDLAATQVSAIGSRMSDPAGAKGRLEAHAREMNVELPKREQARERRAQAAIDRAEREFTGSLAGVERRGFAESPFERRTNPSRTDGQGGYFVPPLWLIDEYIPGLRAGRVGAGLCRQMDLPEGTDSINIPKLSTLTKVDVQTADNQAVASQDFTDTSVSAGVYTLAGQEDVAIQLIEQSPGQIIDRVVMEDLLADYNLRLDAQVLTGTGSSGQVTGILPSTNWSGTNAVTWTSTTPSTLSFNQAVGAAVSKIATNRYDLSNVAVLNHPRRWFWFATGLDLTGSGTATNARPIVNAEGFGPFNVAALEQSPTPAQGLAGRYPFGPNAYVDANLPVLATAAGAITGGTNDLSVVAKWDDCWLFEGALRTRVLPEVLSGTLEIRFQVYNYIAFLVRYGQSLAVIKGTGMAAPVGSIDNSITF
jgi:hypothetical protein